MPSHAHSRSDDDGAAGANRRQSEQEAVRAAREFEMRGRSVAQSLSGQFAWRTILWFLSVLAGLAAVASLALAGFLSYWVAVPVNAVLIYFIFAPLHEAVHDNIAGPRKHLRFLQTVIGQVSGMILLAPYPGFRALHIHHHKHTNDAVEDPDYWVKGDNYLFVILRCMVIQPVYIMHLYKIARDPETMKAFVYEMVCVFSYIPIVAGAYAIGWGPELMLLWILPGYIGVVICPLMFDWPVHHPHTERGRYSDSAILLFPKPIRRFVDFFFIGHAYHLMHHLYPRIPFYHYGTAYYALEAELPKIGAKIRSIAL